MGWQRGHTDGTGGLTHRRALKLRAKTHRDAPGTVDKPRDGNKKPQVTQPVARGGK